MGLVPRVLLLGTSGAHRVVDADEECRAVKRALDDPPHGGRLALVPMLAARAEELSPALYAHRPSVLHLAGHGEPGRGLLFRTDDGGDAPVGLGALCELVAAAADPQVDLVMATVCHTAELVRTMVGHGACAIGMDGQLSTSSAVTFSRAVYSALAAGYSIGRAFDDACRNLALGLQPDVRVPVLAAPPGVDPRTVFVVPPHLRSPVNRDAVKPPARLVDRPGGGKRTFLVVSETYAVSVDEARLRAQSVGQVVRHISDL